MALLEAVLWIQPNFALSWQHDMTNLLRTQTDNLNQLAQNAARDHIAQAVSQKQAELIARELEMVARANVQIRNTQTALLDKGPAKPSAKFNPRQNLPQLFAIANDGGDKGNRGAISGKSVKDAATSGAVPLMSNSQAYAVACCVIIACFSAFSNEFNSVPDSSDSDASSVSSPVNDDDDDAAMKRPRDDDDAEDGGVVDEKKAVVLSEEDSVTTSADGKRGRKRAKLDVHAPSAVHFGQAKKKNCHKRRVAKNISESESLGFNSPEIASDDSLVCSPVSPVPASSGLFSTLPPEMVSSFEAEHACYFHGISCPTSVSSPKTPVHSYSMMPVISASPSLGSPMYDHDSFGQQRVTAIDPALLMEPGSPQQEASFTASVSSEHSSEVAAEDEEPSEPEPDPAMFDAAMEPMAQHVFY